MQNYFKNCKDLQEVKKLFRDLALKFHPDKGGSTQDMQELNAQYEAVLKNPFFKFAEQSEADQAEFIKYPDIISKVVGLPGIIIEIIGNWLWISGNTFAHRTHLKESGFFFAPKKVMWYYRPPEWKSSNRKPIEIDEIRRKYGSDRIDNNDDGIKRIA